MIFILITPFLLAVLYMLYMVMIDPFIGRPIWFLDSDYRVYRGYIIRETYGGEFFAYESFFNATWYKPEPVSYLGGAWNKNCTSLDEIMKGIDRIEDAKHKRKFKQTLED